MGVVCYIQVMRSRSARPLSKRDVRALMEVRRKLTFQTAHFAHFWKSDGDPLPKSEEEVNEFIRRRTHLFISSWIMPVLDEMIERGGDKEES